MKVNNRRRTIQDVVWVCRSKTLLLLLVLCLAGRVEAVLPQNSSIAEFFNVGERVNYDLYFKWGVLMPKAGLATISVCESMYAGSPAWQYQLLFRSFGMMEKIYSMRDTIDCRFSTNGKLLFSSKRTNEGGYKLVDDLTFNYNGNKVSAHSHRYTPKETKIDTVLTAEGYVFDMLAATMYMRSIDWSTIKEGDEFPFRIAIGRDMVSSSFRYAGQQIVERGEVKYRTRLFYIDIFDEAFVQSRAAAEVWLGDDANHLPIKIRAKLKIGAAEVYLNSFYNLRHPLSCRIILPKK